MRILVAAISATALITFAPPNAHADLIVDYSLNGGPFTQLTDVVGGGPAVLGSEVLGDFSFSHLQVVPTQTPSLAELATDITDLTLGSGAQTSEYLELEFGFNNIISQVAPQQLAQPPSLSGQVGFGSMLPQASVGSLESCLFASVIVANNCVGADDTLSNAPLNIVGPGNYKNTSSTIIDNPSAPYTLVQLVTVTLSRGATLDVQATTDVATVSEPLSLSVLCAALVGLGVIRRGRPLSV
jgi:hypothetical protein